MARPLPPPMSSATLDEALAFDRQYPAAMAPGERCAVATAAAWREVARGLATWVESDVSENGAPDCATAKRLLATRGDHDALIACLPNGPLRPADPCGQPSLEVASDLSPSPAAPTATGSVSPAPEDATGAGACAWGSKLPNAPGAWLVAFDDETDMEACWTLLPVFRDDDGLVCQGSHPIDGQPCSVTVEEKLRALHGNGLSSLRFAGPLRVVPLAPVRGGGA